MRRGSEAEQTSPAPRSNESLDVSLWLRLLESHNLVMGELRRRLGPGPTLARFDLLSILEAEDGLTPAELSRRLRVTAGNLTGLVDRAQRDGLVVRKSDPDDRRLSHIFLTKKGRALIVEMLPTHAKHVSSIVSGLDVADRRALRTLLGKLRGSLLEKREGQS